jgi:hypothetical protein
VRALLAILALAISLSPRVAAADSVGLLVLGDYLKQPTRDQGEKWLRDHDQQPETSPLPADAVKVLQDCFIVDDPKCSRSVIDSRATTPSVVAIRVEVTSKKDKDVRLTIDWFVKGHNPVSSRRTCEACTENVLRTTLDAMMLDLAKNKPGFMGRIKVTSTPAGMTVLVDGATAGITPLERDLPAGGHKLRLVQDGRMGAEKAVTIAAGAPMDVTLEAPPPPKELPPPPPPPGKSSRVLPGVLIGIGVAGIGAGAALYFTSEKPDGTNRTYRDTKKLGMGVAGGGAALAITGVIIILATGGNSGPTVSTTAGGATVGWIGRF